ncbi:hypothetical protein GCM10010398_20170 [Streptomyces fimbriatus]
MRTTGFCEGLTSYSALPYETVRPAETGAEFFAPVNVIAGVAPAEATRARSEAPAAHDDTVRSGQHPQGPR